MVRNQFGMNVKILRSDNGTEYINGEFSNCHIPNLETKKNLVLQDQNSEPTKTF